MSEFKPDIFVHGLLPMVLLAAGLMCFRFKAIVPGIVCWAMAAGVFIGVARAHGEDALGAVIAIDLIWIFFIAVAWGVVSLLGFGAKKATEDLPSGDWRNFRGNGGGGEPHRPRGERKPAPKAKSEKLEPIPQIAPDPVKEQPKGRSRFAMTCKPPAKRK